MLTEAKKRADKKYNKTKRSFINVSKEVHELLTQFKDEGVADSYDGVIRHLIEDYKHNIYK